MKKSATIAGKSKLYLTDRVVLFFTLIIAALIWSFYFSPKLLRLPDDFSYSAKIISKDNFYSRERDTFQGEQYSKTTYSYNTFEADDNNLVIKHTLDVKTLEDQPIFSVERIYGINRTTGRHQPGLGDKDREGYLFAPAKLRKGQSFTYWHVNYDQPAVMKFVSEELLYGTPVYKYETHYEGYRIDQTENLDYLPGVGETLGIELEAHLELWVEPLTGRLIKYHDDTTAYYYNLQTGKRLYPWNAFSNTFDEKSVQEQVNIVTKQKSIQQIIQVYIPSILVACGFIILLSNQPFRVRYRRFKGVEITMTSAVILGTISVCSLTLLGWATRTEGLITLGGTSTATTNPYTAISFILICLLLCKLTHLPTYTKLFLSTIVGSISIVNIIEKLGYISFAIDQSLFTDYIKSLNSHMSLFTSFCFLLLILSFAASGKKVLQHLYLDTIATLSVAILSGLAIIGHLVELSGFLDIPLFSATSFLTAILMFALSFNLFSKGINSNETRLSKLNNLLIFGLLFTLIISTTIIAVLIDRNYTSDAEVQFEDEVAHMENSINDRVNIYINALEGTKGLLSASDNVTRDEWKTYVDSLGITKNYPGIQGIGYSIFVKPEEKRTHTKAIRKEGFPEYAIKPPGKRDIYTAIIYLEPFDERNKQAFGFDMFQEPNRRNAMEQARDTGEARASAKITLVQEIDEDVQAGFLIYVPIYQNGTTTDSIEDKRVNIIGYAYSPFRARDFVEGAIERLEHQNIALQINDGLEVDAESEIFSSQTDKYWEAADARFTTTAIINVAGRPWTLNFNSTPDYGKTTSSTLIPLVVIIIGGLVSIPTTSIGYTIINSRRNALEYAKEATKDLEAALAKDEAVLLSIGEGLIVTDKNGKILIVNDAFEELLGWTEKEIQGKKLVEVVNMYTSKNELVPAEDRTISKSIKGKKVITERLSGVQYERKNGTLFPVSITVSPVIVKGRVTGAVEVFRDISKEQEVDKAKTEFVSLASHQLRTPLTAINWYAELMDDSAQDNPLSQDQIDYKNEIATASRRMVLLVDTLLNVSRLELGTFTMNPKNIDLREIFDSVAQEVKLLIEKKHQKFSVSSKKLPVVKIDPELFRIVYQNLITNAIKYTPEKGSIKVDFKLDKDSITISVEDTGYGIPKEQQKHIFEKLYRADNIKDKDTEGTGLGLYIVKSIIEKSGGRVWFVSKENKGTTFFVEIPRIKDRKTEK